MTNRHILIIKNHSSAHGYKALLFLIDLHHQVFPTHPTTIIRAPPRQKKTESLTEFYYRYLDSLKLRSFLKDDTQDLDHKTEMDNFIHGTLDASEFFRLS